MQNVYNANAVTENCICCRTGQSPTNSQNIQSN